MADSSCGPSNAFKGLARHIEQDRSHQQDRLVHGSHQHAQGSFRSSSHHDANLQAQFNAFQAQKAVLPEEALAHHGGTALRPLPYQQPLPQPQYKGPLGAAMTSNDWANQFQRNTWVNDFQRMDLSRDNARPLHYQSVQPGQHAAVGQPSPFEQLQKLPPTQFTHSTPWGSGAFAPYGQMQQPMPSHLSTQPLQESVKDAQETARLEAELDEQFAKAMNDWAVQNGAEESLADTAEVESAEPALQEEEPAKEEQTELARAAQELVDSLADNDTEKFKNSEFLSLMRRIASRQLTVQGNDLVEASMSSDSPDTDSEPRRPTFHKRTDSFGAPSHKADEKLIDI
ncbi:hypothetical protein F4808DRAFT_105745 [Astrocystis sublimbata]|nr:hypothetical protein F4808DRAFT_105745 [Astrocystis sublimbata]